MKGINVKKIATLAGAALLLGSAAIVAADVTFGNTMIVDNNGNPTVKVIVGSNAAISDGVAAANIAAAIANLAYKSEAISATSTGTPTCTVGGNVTGAGSCSIVQSSKQVTLTVSVPGQVAGQYTFNTLITDTIDKTPANRIFGSSTGDEVYQADLPTTDTPSSDQGLEMGDTSTTPLSPLRGVSDISNSAATYLYRIGGAQFPAFADQTITDTEASTTTTYTESQSFYIGSSANAVIFDDTQHNLVVNKLTAAAYDIKFTGNDYGIPVCTDSLNTATPADYTSCITAGNTNSQTSEHRLPIQFMGNTWIISGMNPPGYPAAANVTAAPALASATGAMPGGSITLAQEAKYGIVNVGGVLDSGVFQVRLSDISVATGNTNVHPAILDILDENGNVVGQIQVDPGNTYTFNSGGQSVMVHIYQTAPGFTLNAKWAEMAIYNNQITLQDSDTYNLVSNTDPDKDFMVSLLWKNDGWSVQDDNQSDALREIVIYDDSFNGVGSLGNGKLYAGDVYSFLQTNPTYTLTFQGLDLTNSQYVPVTYSVETDPFSSVAARSGDNDDCVNSIQYNNAKMIEVQTSGGNLFGGANNLIGGDEMVDQFYYDPVGLIYENDSNHSGAATSFANYNLYNASESGNAIYGDNPAYNDQSQWIPTVFWKDPNKNCYNWAPLQGGINSDASYVRFDTAGSNSQAQGGIFFLNGNGLTNYGISNTEFNGAVVLQEDAGEVNTSSDNLVYTVVPFIVNDTNTVAVSPASTLAFEQQGNTNTQDVFYAGVDANGPNGYTPYYNSGKAVSVSLPFMTERGSKVDDLGQNSVDLSVATQVGEPTFEFASAGTNSSATTGQQYVMGVGDSQTLSDGTTITVTAIAATAGGCSVSGANGAPACTVDSSGVAAMISPDNVANETVIQPVLLSSNLVELDSQASNVADVVSVGGPDVNTVTASLLSGSNVDFTSPVVKEISTGKIVVAGMTAQDTMTAADEFIAAIQNQSM